MSRKSLYAKMLEFLRRNGVYEPGGLLVPDDKGFIHPDGPSGSISEAEVQAVLLMMEELFPGPIRIELTHPSPEDGPGFARFTARNGRWVDTPYISALTIQGALKKEVFQTDQTELLN